MSNSTHFCYKTLLVFVLAAFFNGSKLEAQDSSAFEQKWEQAEVYLKEKQTDSLLVIIKSMDTLSSLKDKVNVGKLAYLKGEYWYSLDHWSKSLSFFNIAIDRLEGDQNKAGVLAESYLVGGYCLLELDRLEEAIVYYQKALVIKKQLLGENHDKVSSIYFNLGFVEQERNNLIQSDRYLREGLAILEEKYKEETVLIADFYEELGYNQKTKGDYKQAIKYLKKGLRIKNRILGENHPESIFSYDYLGRSYKETEEYEKAVSYFTRALAIAEKQPERDVFSVALFYLLIGKCFINLNQHSEAYEFFDKAIRVDSSNLYIAAEINRLKGEIASKNGEEDRAWYYFNRALTGFANYVNGRKYQLEVYISMVEHLIATKKFTVALSYLDKAIELGRVIHRDTPINLFDLYQFKAVCYAQLRDKAKAASYLKKARVVNGGSVDPRVANLIQLKNQISLNKELVQLNPGTVESETTPERLREADSLLMLTIDLSDYIIRNYQERSTKENFVEKFYQIFKKAVDVKYQLYYHSGDKAYLEQAFVLSEKSKNLLILQTLKGVSEYESSGIPKALLDRENELKTNITYLENKRYEENQGNPQSDVRIKRLNAEIFDMKQQFEGLIEEVKKEYPQYYQLKFDKSSLSVREIQAKLPDHDQSLVEYFISDDNIYAFLIRKGSFDVFPLQADEGLEQKIFQFRESIYSYRPPSFSNKDSKTDTLLHKTIALGTALYQQLIKPFQPKLGSRITIIADGSLGYLPFDALLKDRPVEMNSPSGFPYFMNDHIVSFAHSVSWLSQLDRPVKETFPYDFLGFAPTFKGGESTVSVDEFRGGLGPLKYSQEEVREIKNTIGGLIVLGEEATRKKFLENLTNGRILHLATHGKSNDAQGDYSYLAFAEPKDSLDQQLLYVRDLFNLQIASELVVLSACETGLGEIKRGEGIVGIGKGFSYAGARSLITTLWRVSDNSTARIMPLFYRNLKAGKPKDEAMWLAKKELISSVRTAWHPFFWSAYVAYGNMQPVQWTDDWFSFPFTLFFLVIVVVLVFWYFKE